MWSDVALALGLPPTYGLDDVLPAVQRVAEDNGILEAERDALRTRIAEVERERDEAVEALTKIAQVQPQAVAWFRKTGVVFERVPTRRNINRAEDGAWWEWVAFCIYNYLIEADIIARTLTNQNEGGLDEPTARLIAAAPDLLEAAGRALVMLTAQGNANSVTDVLRAAIAKAKGEA